MRRVLSKRRALSFFLEYPPHVSACLPRYAPSPPPRRDYETDGWLRRAPHDHKNSVLHTCNSNYTCHYTDSTGCPTTREFDKYINDEFSNFERKRDQYFYNKNFSVPYTYLRLELQFCNGKAFWYWKEECDLNA